MVNRANSLKQASERLGIGISTIYVLIGDGQLSAKKLLSKTVIFDDEIDRFLAELPDAEMGRSRLKGKPRKRRDPDDEGAPA